MDVSQRQSIPEPSVSETRTWATYTTNRLKRVRAVLRQKHRDVFDLLLLTGARPGEIIGLRTGDIERTGDVWRCEIQKHKTTRHGKRRVLFFNGPAQLILRKYLTADPAARLFKPSPDLGLERLCALARFYGISGARV